MRFSSRRRLCPFLVALTVAIALVSAAWGHYSPGPQGFRGVVVRDDQARTQFERLEQFDRLQWEQLQWEEERENKTSDGQSGRSVNGQSTVSVVQMNVPKNAQKALQRAYEAKTGTDQALFVEKALKIYPHYADALALRALLEMKGNPEQALTDATNAVEYDPNCGIAYLALGSTSTSRGKFDEAIPQLNHAIILMPDAWQGYYELSIALSGTRDYTAALRNLERAHLLVAKAPPFFHILKATILLGLKNDSAAITELRSYLREEPTGQWSELARSILEQKQSTRSSN
jgi:tetratricopeptide (TPR) repeat protein